MADKKISELPVADTLTGSELAEVVQGGVNKRAPASQFGVNHYRGVYDLSTEAYPSSGGTGTGGIPAAGDYWIGGNSGDFDVEDIGTVTLFRGAMLIYIGGTVSDPNSWVVKQ